LREIMKVRAITKMYYGRRDRLPGEVYEMDEREHSEVNVLVALGKLELVKDEEKMPVPYMGIDYDPREKEIAFEETKTESIEPEKAEEPQEEPEPPSSPEEKPVTAIDSLTRPKRSYRRRDMRAEK